MQNCRFCKEVGSLAENHVKIVRAKVQVASVTSAYFEPAFFNISPTAFKLLGNFELT
jgi:hypothetical protein